MQAYLIDQWFVVSDYLDVHTGCCLDSAFANEEAVLDTALGCLIDVLRHAWQASVGKPWNP